MMELRNNVFQCYTTRENRITIHSEGAKVHSFLPRIDINAFCNVM